MTREAATKFIDLYKDRSPLSFVKPSHLDELSPLLEVQIEAVEVRKDEFHNLSGSYSPKKETLDKFASAAGISFNALHETTRKEGSAYIGTTQAMVMGPDGKMQSGAPCEYEFDTEVRLEELRLAGKSEWVNREKKNREYTERELAQERVQLMKVGRQRANTGARSRATLMMLGMQTGFKNLFDKDAPDSATKVFLFSRIIVNAKNEMVARALLQGMSGAALSLYGTPPPQQISGPVPNEPINVTPNQGHAPNFDPEIVPEPDPRALKLATLQDLVDKYPTKINPQGLNFSRSVLNNKNASLDEIDICLNGFRDSLLRQGIKLGDGV